MTLWRHHKIEWYIRLGIVDEKSMLSIVVVHALRFSITVFRKRGRSATPKVLLKNYKCMRDKAQDTRGKAHSPTNINPPSNGRKAQSIQSNSHHHALRRVWTTGQWASVGAKFVSSFLREFRWVYSKLPFLETNFCIPTTLFTLLRHVSLTECID